MICKAGKGVAQRRQSPRSPFVEAADIDDDWRQIAAEQRDRGGDAAPRRELYLGEFLAALRAGDLRTIRAGDFGRRGGKVPIAAEAQPRLVLAVDDAGLVDVPIETALVLDPLADDTGDHCLPPHQLAMASALGCAVIRDRQVVAAPLSFRPRLHCASPMAA